jgi:hypothetical protein
VAGQSGGDHSARRNADNACLVVSIADRAPLRRRRWRPGKLANRDVEPARPQDRLLGGVAGAPDIGVAEVSPANAAATARK